jgi:hypothetical protein
MDDLIVRDKALRLSRMRAVVHHTVISVGVHLGLGLDEKSECTGVSDQELFWDTEEVRLCLYAESLVWIFLATEQEHMSTVRDFEFPLRGRAVVMGQLGCCRMNVPIQDVILQLMEWNF